MRTRLGWIPDLPDNRDHLLHMPSLAHLPAKHELKMDFCYDQRELGSCTAQAASAAYQYTELEQDGLAPIPSRLALYYWTRKEMGMIDFDSGASIRGTIKAMAKNGMCREVSWPYDTSRFSKQPHANAILESTKHKLGSRAYARVGQSLLELKTCLIQGNPIIFGFSVYESFMQELVRRTGVMQIPKPNEKMLGGHAVLMIGYDDARKAFLCKNSWGQYWGLRGNWYMPYDYAISKDLCDDHWAIHKVVPLS